ncbi:MAG: glycosyltransferase [Actinobacteria bacterium]|nr:glycosyltransferase [Actinomycetota bacterium]
MGRHRAVPGAGEGGAGGGRRRRGSRSCGGSRRAARRPGRWAGGRANHGRAHLRPQGGAGRRALAGEAGALTVELSIVFLGLSITSSWGNGHATNYRGLVRALEERGHDVLFLERDTQWYRDNRDLPAPPHGRTELYDSVQDLQQRFAAEVAHADLVVVGSYVPDGIEVAQWVQSIAGGTRAFYDIDTPVTLAALERGDCAYLSPELVPRFDLYLSFTAGPILDVLRDRFGCRRPVPFHCLVDPEAYPPADGPLRWDLGYLGTFSEDRQPVLERLLLEPARRRPALRFVVAGPQYPSSVDWPPNVERIEHLPPSEHPGFYAAQRMTLNVTRADMVRAGWSPSVRLFEAAACAVPVISDRWDGIEEFFVPGHEILLADGPDDVLQILENMDHDARRDMGRRARDRVLAEHTAQSRAVALERMAMDLLGERLSPPSGSHP